MTAHVVATSDAARSTPTRIWWQVAADVRWAFTRPYTWLAGVGANLVLSLVWLIAAPITGQPHRDWAIMVGTYFAVFILADVTTTNVLGADARRVRLSLMRQISLRRILLVKNITLFLIVGLPTLLATALITVASEADYRLLVTLPGVAFPILTWLGVGNVVSVAFPVAAASLRQRWEQRHQRRTTVRWVVAVLLPYALLVPVDPVSQLPRILIRAVPALPNTLLSRGLALLVTGLLLYGAGTAAALTIARLRKLRFDDSR